MPAEPGDREDREARPRLKAEEWTPPLRGKIPPDLPPFDIHKFREEICTGEPHDYWALRQ